MSEITELAGKDEQLDHLLLNCQNVLFKIAPGAQTKPGSQHSEGGARTTGSNVATRACTGFLMHDSLALGIYASHTLNGR